jgi:hypothetical protein
LRRNRYSGPSGVPSEPTAVHSEHCPFCGADFDARDLGQVLEHYGHQVAAGVAAMDETAKEDQRKAAGDTNQGRIEEGDHGGDTKLHH